MLCHTGEECIVVDNNAACMCKKSCPNHEKPVCGSNGMTYPNHCELHRTACVEKKKISIKYEGTCRGQPTQPPPASKVNQSKPGRLIDYPFKPQYQHAYSPCCSPHVSYDTTWENLLKHQDIPSLMIIPFIHVKCMFDKSVTL